ncbi:MAG: hypothetical protein A3H69_04010 [Candidatus Sungbacteria bacterium RIFCSPLOWO2_02_FULL_47_9]|uniref:Uncharacterized protein n=1 Tax=Candidatus Sungbacteria bacterium RIFCSPHIGHO2_01_FULL_47_32 TaxID=1802264 RepID=A0A1G2K7H1_9BACT|nr:MAG: hypothetical protein UX72_C0049G0005 [Parcubacteria group bacterium GW2011_GWA2_47_10]OGZ95367.1 MAG: hypothetical protein A2633_04255 [Candidatus Sungbacteria bacterium RIFCSPHIGHO2_01_FULL_47_32]OGZ98864.1 MAG: hypothetical protein A3D57_03910 [Candidatus Sungbacteria bacterium RIFCSPHIGHO2_02_FULL_46_12]OHA05237.1 MAG: hypothetical protein A3A28_04195 [Candidatus Sungbacteria bacterium RIFCSPLOWO2_01_FULL_47_32]OHA10328.1 MAG: hypothetical protein A3H69_04010 [Candidatus Sungbacteria
MDTPERPELVDTDELVSLTKSFEAGKTAEKEKNSRDRQARVDAITEKITPDIHKTIGPKTREAAAEGRNSVVISSFTSNGDPEYLDGWRQACRHIAGDYRKAQSKLRLETREHEHSPGSDEYYRPYTEYQFTATWG